LAISSAFERTLIYRIVSYLRLAVLIQYRLVTDGQTDRHTDGRAMSANTALA